MSTSPPVFLNGNAGDMATIMADTGYKAFAGDLSPKRKVHDLNILRQSTIEEDDSSLSSTGTETFDRDSAISSQKDRWQLDGNGKWQQYGSLESATSTGASSMSSSVAADDALTDNVTLVQPSRKRWVDGGLKNHSPLAMQSESPVARTQMENAITEDPQQPPQKVPKKRGRPPKIRPLGPDGTPIFTPKATPKAQGTPRVPKIPKIVRPEITVRPRSSIPTRLPADVIASQCIEAATSSRLDPYALHPGEHRLLHTLLMSKEVTVYLNIRNSILRLWTQNPLCSVSPQEAAGCAKETRFFGIAEAAYRWLTRNGYINFGCAEILKDPSLPKKLGKDMRQRTVVVVGAGVAGLTAARQLESLFAQEAAKWVEMNERPPRVIVLEGRGRIGGRVYSKPLRSQVSGSLPDDLRNTAETGAMIVTGFDHGNPLDTVIRGQLGLRYHLMKDALTIYDVDGSPIDETKDKLCTDLYTDISDRAGQYRAEAKKQQTLEGDEDLINRCRDPPPDGFAAFQLEPLPEAHLKSHKPAARRGRRRNAPPGTEKLTGRSEIMEGETAIHSASKAVKDMGWQVKEGVARNQSISLTKAASSSAHPTLGKVMDEAITQYQDLIDLTPMDMRLLNWHHANLEYANAAPVTSLSLSGHDQDTGNEFEGAHSEIVGGYTQLPRGLMNLPTKLDVRFNCSIDSIHYENGDDNNGSLSTKVVCTDGTTIDADEVVMTAPLGVLKSDMIDFDPPLPGWKRDAIDRMGFGLLNKVILLYDKPFWDDERDMFGLLNEAERKASLNPSDYERKRGRFYLIWNASKTSGRPMLIALMAGNAAHDAEITDTSTLLSEVTERLSGVFTSAEVPAPREVIVTRWKRDPFSRGTYSYVAPETRPGDYDLMARSVGNLHFAGEATCGTHPATVHGAFLSGLRVAADVMDDMIGLISLPKPLVGPGPVKPEVQGEYMIPYAATEPHYQSQVGTATIEGAADFSGTPAQPSLPAVKLEEDAFQFAAVPQTHPPLQSAAPKKLSGPPKQSVCASDTSFWVSTSSSAQNGSDLDYEAAIIATTLSQIGDRPLKPARPGVNPFLLFTKDKWEACKIACAKESAPAGRDLIRQTIGKWWKAATEADKEPYLAQSQNAQELADQVRKEWEVNVVKWDADARRIRAEYMAEHPMEGGSGMGGGGVGVSKRKTNVSNCVVLDHA